MVTGELKGRLIVNYLRLLWLESKGAQSSCPIMRRAPAPASLAIIVREVQPARLAKNFWKLREHSR